MENGQAPEAPMTDDELVALLTDNPEGAGEKAAQEPTDDSPEQDNEPAQTDDDEAPEDEPDTPRKYKVTIKGDDGSDLEQEVDEKELIDGYQRRADYTRKTQELSRRESEALELVQARVTQAQNHYIQQVQMAQAAVMHLAGMRSPEEMAALARSDPAGYVAEQARVNQVQAVMAQLQGQMQQEQMRAQAQQQEALQQAFARCWGTLGQKGIDKPKLQRIFDTVSREYGIPQERFANLADPAVVLVMADAAAYRDLLKRKGEAVKKTEAAPRLPPKQNTPRTETTARRQEDRLRSGKGSTDDLAAFIARNNL